MTGRPWLRRAVALGVLVAAWQALFWSGMVPERYLPGPARVADAAVTLAAQPQVRAAEMLSLGRAVAGLALTVAVALALALVGEVWAPLRRAIAPLAELMRPVSPAALVPVATFALGFGTASHLLIIVLAATWPVYFSTVSGLAGISPVLVHAGRSLGYGRWEILLRLRLPQALPQIFTGLRLGAAVSLIAVVVAEMLGGRDGIGHLLFVKAFGLRIADVFALTVLCGLNGMLLNQGVLVVRRLLLSWHDRQKIALGE